jgi:hypothetical protein
MTVEELPNGQFRILTDRGTPLGARFLKGKAGHVDQPDPVFTFASLADANRAKAKWMQYFYALKRNKK